MCSFIIILQKKFIRKKRDSLLQYNFLDLSTQVYFNASETPSHSNFDFPFLYFFLFHPLFLLIFYWFISFGVEAPHLFFPCTTHLQYHIITILVFTLDVFLGSSTDILSKKLFMV